MSTQYDPDKPQIFIPNARVEHVRGVAMGMAKSKGWTFVDSTDDTLLLQRPLNAAAAESIEPGAGLGPLPAVVEVRTQFFPRLGGVDVVVDAEASIHRGTDREERVDFTETYQGELMRSLASLQRAWTESRARVVAAVPPPSSPTAHANEASAPVPNEGIATAKAEANQNTPDRDTSSTPSTATLTAWGNSPALAPAAPSPEPIDSAPTAIPQVAAIPAPVQESSAEPTDLKDNMVSLQQPQDAGTWAYYAEQYARIRGCALAGEGAVLIEKTNAYEVHRVYCEGGTTFQVKCNAGTCRGMR